MTKKQGFVSRRSNAKPALTGRLDLPKARVFLLILATAAYQSLDLWADHPWGFNHPERLIPIILVGWVLGLVVFFVARRMGADDVAALGGSVVWTALVTAGGGISKGWPILLTFLVVSATGAAVVVLLHRLSEFGGREAVIVGLVAVLIAGPVVAATQHLLTRREFSLAPATTDVPDSLASKPDIFVVVLDGFIGFPGLEEVFGPQDEWIEGLRQAGYEVPESAWASYPVSIASIPSLLQMGYPVDESHALQKPGWAELDDVISGDNRLFQTAATNGYETVMIEAGWSRSQCGPAVDRCVPSPFLDEATYAVVKNSIFSDWFRRRLGSSFTNGAVHAMDHLREYGPRYASDGTPTLVFAHLMVPHPPFLLDQSCNYQPAAEHTGSTPWSDESKKDATKAAYLDQASCAARFAVEFIDTLPETAVVVLAADHGSESDGQLATPAEEWTASDAVERLNVFLAVRGPSGCRIGSPVLIPNVMRVVLSCLANEEPGAMAARMFFGSTRPESGSSFFSEAEPDVVAALLDLDFNTAAALLKS